MDIAKYKPMIDETITGMLEYMAELEECAYSKKDVIKCETILTQYLDALAVLDTPTDKDILKCVKKCVVALNKLSEKTDYEMIESVERDNICEIIQTAAEECGLNDASEDVTEEWREW